jgi:hypothetical protein
MGVAFILLAFLFLAFSIWYLYTNDFAKETMEVIFPAISAILLAFYLAFKAIYVDAPKPEHFGGPVAILLNSSSGELHGVPQPSLRFPSSIDEFRGAFLIDELPRYNAFTILALPEKVRRAEPPMPPEIVGYTIEYALLSWLTKPDMVPGATLRRTQKLIAGSGGTVGVPTNLVAVKAVDRSMSRNPLLATSPLDLLLPKGSSVSRIDGKPLSVEIRTRHSILQVRWLGTTCELLRGPLTPDHTKLYEALSLPLHPASNLTLCAYDVEFEFRQGSFRRFSRQAKLESEWFARIRSQFEQDFSWNYLRKIVLGT